jgi:hypothetical protein
MIGIDMDEIKVSKHGEFFSILNKRYYQGSSTPNRGAVKL